MARSSVPAAYNNRQIGGYKKSSTKVNKVPMDKKKETSTNKLKKTIKGK